MALNPARSGLARSNNSRSNYIKSVVFALVRSLIIGFRNRTILVNQR